MVTRPLLLLTLLMEEGEPEDEVKVNASKTTETTGRGLADSEVRVCRLVRVTRKGGDSSQPDRARDWVRSADSPQVSLHSQYGGE